MVTGRLRPNIDVVDFDPVSDNPLLQHLLGLDNSRVVRGSYDIEGWRRPATLSLVLLTAIPFTVFLLSSWLTSTLIMPGPDVGFLEDIPHIGLLLLFPVILLLSRFFFVRLRIFAIRITDVLDLEEVSADEYQEYLTLKEEAIQGKGRYFYPKLVWYAIVILGLAWWILGESWLLISFPFNSWRFVTGHPLNFLLASVYFSVLALIGSSLVWRLVTSLITLSTFSGDFEESLYPVVVHPDGVGGFKPLGDAVFAFYMVSLAPLIHSAISLVAWGVTTGSILTIMYLPVLTIIFIAPMVPAHRIMTTRKNEALHEISLCYEDVRSPDSTMTEKDSDQLDLDLQDDASRVREYFHNISRLPTWPVKTEIVQGFVATLLVPALILLVEILLLNG